MEIASGRLWRAKEILLGRMASSAYEPTLFAKLAEVLAEMRDDDEAGRYYLLGGSIASPAAENLAEAFLHRRRTLSIEALWETMPAAARRLSSASLPVATIELFTKSGYKREAIDALVEKMGQRIATKQLEAGPGTWGVSVGVFLGLAGIVLVFLLGIRGLFQILASLFQHVFQ
jgi:hypothetical protein